MWGRRAFRAGPGATVVATSPVTRSSSVLEEEPTCVTVLREAVLGHLAAAANAERQVAPGLELEQAEVTGLPVAVLRAESAAAEMVVLGDRGLGGFTGLLVGSVAVELAACASCPVVVVRGPEQDHVTPRAEPVVIGVDGSPVSEAAMAFAFEAAALRACRWWPCTCGTTS
jgi:nucleotide-binding universal stress UspA family protein